MHPHNDFFIAGNAGNKYIYSNTCKHIESQDISKNRTSCLQLPRINKDLNYVLQVKNIVFYTSRN